MKDDRGEMRQMENKKVKRGHIFYLVLFILFIFILSFLSFSLVWVSDHYGNVSFDEIVFHLRMPLQGTSMQFIKSFLDTALKPSLYTAIELSAGILLFRSAFLTFTQTKFLWLQYTNIMRRSGVLAITIWIELL